MPAPPTGCCSANGFFARVAVSQQQRAAITFPAGQPLQILAGPGSGKTRTLTARVAYLVDVRRMDPTQIVVVTFTNRAAQEMRTRLWALLGHERSDKLLLGTFHSICLRLLRRHARLLPDLGQGRFIVAGEDDAKKIVTKIIAELPARLRPGDSVKPGELPSDGEDVGPDSDLLASKAMRTRSPEDNKRARKLQPAEVRQRISRWKTFSKSVEAVQSTALASQDLTEEAMAWVYEQYQLRLRAMEALDFDDLISRTIELLRAHPEVVSHVSEVLVDEFQDTSAGQLDLVNLLAQQKKSLTVVGDPDQSIYGWRAADRSNLDKMHALYGEPVGSSGKRAVATVLLQESYRSAEGILRLAQFVIEQDSTRPVPKNLVPVHRAGQRPTVVAFASAQDEARWTAQRINEMVSESGGLIRFNDIAVLVRSNALSRPFELAFAEARVPVRLQGTVAFFQRKEVVDIISYLHLVYNPLFTPSFERAVNVPSRKLGVVFVRDFVSMADTRREAPMVFAERLALGEVTDPALTGAKLESLTSFASIIIRARKMVLAARPLALVLKWIIQASKYDVLLEGLDQAERESRMENVLELVSIAAELDGIKKRTVQETQGSQEDGTLAAPLHRPPASQNKSDMSNKLDSWFDMLDVKEEDAPPLNESKGRRSFTDMFNLKRPREDSSVGGVKQRRANLEDAPIVREPAEDSPSLALEGAMDKLGELMSMANLGSKEEDEKLPAVTVSSCHGAKGLEWPVVFVAGCEEGIIPSPQRRDDEEMQEEIRLLFVALTRAEALLFVTCANVRVRAGKAMNHGLTPFLRNPDWRPGSRAPILHPKLNDIVALKPWVKFAPLVEECSEILRRPAPSQEARRECKKEYVAPWQHSSYN